MDKAKCVCHLCKKKFSTISNLRNHARKFHPGKCKANKFTFNVTYYICALDATDSIAPKKVYKHAVVCDECSKPFYKKSNLTKHVMRFHSGKSV